MAVDVIELELKYCERCGGLWLRARGTEQVYCPACSGAMDGPRAARKAKRRLRAPLNSRLELMKSEGTSSVFTEGGNA